MNTKRTDGKKIAERIVFTVLTLAFMLLIFSFSAQNADQSNASGGRVTGLLQRIFFPAYSELPAAEYEIFIGKLTYLVRKVAHFSEYLVLGLLLSRTLKAYGISYGKRIIFGILIALLYAVLDECHQLFVPGRSGAFFDVLVDTAGAVNGVLLMTGLSAIRDANRLVKRAPDGSGAS
ncbi:MAG: VanZ family protein [Lachnospiraceae bacterium]|nr:VanZ family protein [Lachnospiraceae bacterium]